MSLSLIASVGSKAFSAMGASATKMAATVGTSLNNTIGPMASFQAGLDGILEPLTLITEPIAMLGEIIGTELYPVFQPISDAIYDIIPLFQQVASEIGTQLAPIFAQLAPIITQLAPPVVQIIGIFASAFIPVLNGIMGIVTPLIPVFVSLVNALMPLLPVLMPIIYPFSALAMKLELLTPIIESLIPYISGAIDVFANIVSVVANFGQNVWDTLSNGIGVVINWFSGLPQMILDAITSSAVNFGGNVKDWWEGLWD